MPKSKRKKQIFINKKNKCSVSYSLLLAVLIAVLPLVVFANEPMATDNYRLDPNIANSFGGLVDSDSYQLLSSGGEAIVGLGDSPSYKLSQGYSSQLEQAIELNVLPEGLHAYFPLNTGAGIQAYDATPNNNHGTLAGPPAWTTGKIGQGLEFDGNSDWVNYAGVDIPANNAVPATYSAWIKTTNDSSAMAIVGDYNSSHVFNRRYIGVEDGFAAMYHHRSASGEDVISDEFVADGQWHHIAAYLSTDVRVLYVNGREVSRSIQLLDGIPTEPEDAAIGRRNTGSEDSYFEGKIDEVKIYTRQLSDDEVLDEYNASNSGLPASITLPRIGVGESKTTGAEVVIITDAGGYDLSIEQDRDLTLRNSSITIPPIGSSIAFPAPWSEGNTIGFGFTVTDAIQRDSKWGIDPAFEYAAIPSTATTFHSRTGLSGGFKETATIQFRLGVNPTQTSGVYSSRLGFTATLKP